MYYSSFALVAAHARIILRFAPERTICLARALAASAAQHLSPHREVGGLVRKIYSFESRASGDTSVDKTYASTICTGMCRR